MFSFLQSFSKPAQPPVTLIAARFPADSSAPSLVSLTTVRDDKEPDCFLSRLPDLRPFWKTKEGWEWRDIEEMTFENQPNESWNGEYVKWFSFASHDLPENNSVPLIFCHQTRAAAGDVFIAKLASPNTDEHGETAYENFAPGFLEYCLIQNERKIESYIRFREQLKANKAYWPGVFDDVRREWLNEIYEQRRGSRPPEGNGQELGAEAVSLNASDKAYGDIGAQACDYH